MRAVPYGFFASILLAASLAAQSAATSDTTSASVASRFQKIELPQVSTGAPTATSVMDAYLFLPKNPLANPSILLPRETRSPAQLEALLANYVGKWHGDSFWYSTATGHALRAVTEMIYTLKTEKGRKILTGVITYDLPAGPAVSIARLWTENGHIFSEVTQGNLSQKYVAQTNGSSLTWCIYGSMDAVLEFSETETLRLTPGGVQISSQGFEVQHYARGQSFVIETAEMKLVK